jgi:hypothetical protein
MATIWDQQPFGGASPPPASSGNTFYNGGNYGQTQNWNDSPLGGIIREQNPQLAYAQYGQGIGVGDNDSAFNRWFYNQFPRFERGYGLATLQNPTLRMDSYLQTLPGMQALQQQYNLSSPGARGLSIGTFAPSTRWIGR